MTDTSLDDLLVGLRSGEIFFVRVPEAERRFTENDQYTFGIYRLQITTMEGMEGLDDCFVPVHVEHVESSRAQIVVSIVRSVHILNTALQIMLSFELQFSCARDETGNELTNLTELLSLVGKERVDAASVMSRVASRAPTELLSLRRLDFLVKQKP